MTLEELCFGRQQAEAAQKSDLKRWTRYISGEIPPMEFDKELNTNTAVELCKLWERVQLMSPISLRSASVGVLLRLNWAHGRAKRHKLEGKWPQWAFSFCNPKQGYVYAMGALLMLRLPLGLSWRILSVVLRHLEGAA